MNREIIGLTAKQLLGMRRTLLMLGLAALPIVIAVIFRVTQDTSYRFAGNSPEAVAVPEAVYWAANTLFARLIVGTLLPLVALVFGTAALGAEFEDGTAVYLLSKPIPRWRIVLSKLLVAWGATAAIVGVVTVIAVAIVLLGEPAGGGDVPWARGLVIQEWSLPGMVIGFAVAIAAGSLVYCALFVFLSILTSRALISGLLYVFIWEGLLTALFSGVRIFSVRQYTLGLAKGLSNASPQTFATKLNGPEAAILIVLVSVLMVALAIRSLQRWQIGEAG